MLGQLRVMVDKDLHATVCLQHICPNSQVCFTASVLSGEKLRKQKLVSPLHCPKTSILEMLQYDQAHGELHALQLPQVTEYTKSNWHSCRHQWVRYLKNDVFNLGSAGTQRIESAVESERIWKWGGGEPVQSKSGVTNCITCAFDWKPRFAVYRRVRGRPEVAGALSVIKMSRSHAGKFTNRPTSGTRIEHRPCQLVFRQQSVVYVEQVLGKSYKMLCGFRGACGLAEV